MQKVNLTKEELNILICGLNALHYNEEKRLNREYGSVCALYNKLYTHWEELHRIEKILNLGSEQDPDYHTSQIAEKSGFHPSRSKGSGGSLTAPTLNQVSSQ